MSQSNIFLSQALANSITSSCGHPSPCFPKVNAIPSGVDFSKTFAASNGDMPVSPMYFLSLLNSLRTLYISLLTFI